MVILACLLLIVALVYGTNARIHPNIAPPPGLPIVPTPDSPVTDRSGATLPPLNTTYFFNQLIDHRNPSRGTFQQRFWTSWEFYQPGGPVILSTPGEANAAPYIGYLTNLTINGLIAQASNGTTIVLEHRFFGFSNPINSLDDTSLQLLTIEQAISDLTYFAKHVRLPQPNGDRMNADRVPWILVGGSYSGALTSWTMVDQPGVFWAGYASSGVVQAILDYWPYFEPIRQNMPRNCSADIQAVIRHIDQVFTTGTAQEKQNIKAMFGLGGVTHLDDAAGSLRNILWDWQSLQPYVGPNATFFRSCDALEVKNGVNAPASGWGLAHALPAWGSYFKNVYLPALCRGADAETCLGTYNTSQSFWTDPRINNAGRSWMWSICNEVGFFQDGAPRTWPTLVSRLIQPSYDERICHQMFPRAFPSPPTPKVASTNTKYKGWNVDTNRLFFANGRRDPWREATVSSDFHPRLSSSCQPIYISNGFHCSDLIARAAIEPTVNAVMQAGVLTLKRWIAQWPGFRPGPQPPQEVHSDLPPISIPTSAATVTWEAVPSAAAQPTGSSDHLDEEPLTNFAIPNAMTRQSVVL